jgi:hypothetical protein
MPRTKAIETPERLQELFDQYREWVKTSPYMVHDFVGKEGVEVERKRQRPLTWVGFEAWLWREGVVTHLGHYEQNTEGSYTEYLPIIRALKNQCSSDIIDGALSGVFNQNIAARLEGLTDKKELDHKGIPPQTVTYKVTKSEDDD